MKPSMPMGWGSGRVTATLAKAGCKTFFVADLAEARRVRARAPEAVVYVLNGCTPEGSPTFIELNARPVINSMTELAEWDAFHRRPQLAGRRRAACRYRHEPARHVRRRSGRAGAARPTENHGIALLMSHLACAEIADHPLTVAQIKLFRELRSLYRGVPASLANSSGIYLGDAAHCDLVRPGAALYGINPTPGRPNPMRGVVELGGRILQVRSVAEGETVGYGATWTATRRSRIAVVAVGYADGCCAPPAGPTAGAARRRSLPARPARWSVASPWTWLASI